MKQNTIVKSSIMILAIILMAGNFESTNYAKQNSSIDTIETIETAEIEIETETIETENNETKTDETETDETETGETETGETETGETETDETENNETENNETENIAEVGATAISITGPKSDYLIINGYTVTGVTSEGKKQSKIVIPDGIIKIADSAFYSTGNLKEIVLPESLKSIGMNAFYLSGITQITIPKNVETIDNNAFYNCRNLSEINIKSTKLSVGSNIFSGVTSGYYPVIKKLTLPSDMTYIPSSLFHGIYFANIDITIPANVTTIGSMAFYQASGIKSISFAGNKVKTIGQYAFAGSSIPSNFVIPDTVTTINNCAFRTTDLTKAVLPSNLKYLGNEVFNYCYKLTEVEINSPSFTVNDGNYHSEVFRHCPITKITFPKNMTTIPAYLFDYASFDNAEITIPSHIEKIGAAAFRNATGISDMIIPASVKSIYDQPLYNGAFYGIGHDTKFYVVSGSCAEKHLKKYGFESWQIVIARSIKYKLNKGTNSPSNPSVYSSGDVINFQNPTRTGYNFAGWYTDKDFKNKITSTSGYNKNLTLYAKWIAIKYPIIYNLCDSTPANTKATNNKNNIAEYKANKEVTLYKPKRKGFTFKGWYTTSNYSDKPITTFKNKTGGNMTLYAKWAEKSYTVSYSANKGKFAKTPEAKTVKYTETFSLPSADTLAPRNGYSFVGFYTKNAEGKKTRYTAGSSVSRLTTDKNIKFYAEWRKISKK